MIGIDINYTLNKENTTFALLIQIKWNISSKIADPCTDQRDYYTPKINLRENFINGPFAKTSSRVKFINGPIAKISLREIFVN